MNVQIFQGVVQGAGCEGEAEGTLDEAPLELEAEVRCC